MADLTPIQNHPFQITVNGLGEPHLRILMVEEGEGTGTFLTADEALSLAADLTTAARAALAIEFT